MPKLAHRLHLSRAHAGRVLAVGVGLLVAASLLAGPAARVAVAQSGGDYDLSWSSVTGGGGASAGGAYALEGTAGQPAAGDLSGGDYTLAGGFWSGLTAALYALFVPLITR